MIPLADGLTCGSSVLITTNLEFNNYHNYWLAQLIVEAFTIVHCVKGRSIEPCRRCVWTQRTNISTQTNILSHTKISLCLCWLVCRIEWHILVCPRYYKVQTRGQWRAKILDNPSTRVQDYYSSWSCPGCDLTSNRQIEPIAKLQLYQNHKS